MIKLIAIWILIGLIVSVARWTKVMPRVKTAFSEKSIGLAGEIFVADVLGWPWHAYRLVKKAADDDDAGPTPTGTA